MIQVKGVDGTQSNIEGISLSRRVGFERATVTEGPGGEGKWKIAEWRLQRRLIVWGAWRRKSPKSGAMRWMTGSMG